MERPAVGSAGWIMKVVGRWGVTCCERLIEMRGDRQRSQRGRRKDWK